MIELWDSHWSEADGDNDLPVALLQRVAMGDRVVTVFGDLAVYDAWPQPSKATIALLAAVWAHFDQTLPCRIHRVQDDGGSEVVSLTADEYFAQVWGCGIDHVVVFPGMSFTERDASILVFIGSDQSLDQVLGLAQSAVTDTGERLVMYQDGAIPSSNHRDSA